MCNVNIQNYCEAQKVFGVFVFVCMSRCIKYLAITTLTVEVSSKKKIQEKKRNIFTFSNVYCAYTCNSQFAIYRDVHTSILQKFIWAPHCLKSIHTICSYSNEHSLLL